MMRSTPISAKGFEINRLNCPSDNIEVKNTLEKYLTPRVDVFDRKLRSLFSGYSVSKYKDALDHTLYCKEPEATQVWRLIAPLYAVLVDAIVNPKEQYPAQRRTIILDDQFHKSVLFCAFEILRCTFDIQNISLEGILKLVNVRYIELCAVIDMVLKWGCLLFSHSTHKRFVEIQERILESELWSDDKVYELMDDAANKNSSHISETLKFYNDIIDPNNYLQSTVASNFSQSSGPDMFKGLQSVFGRCNLLLKARSKDLCKSAELSTIIANKVIYQCLYSLFHVQC
ncbi:hypothetical protein HK100_004091 [Physocladia obscura]|uniref:Retinoblastoma-associated protein A-box domain-containing protein n=1 Tax=Physocladia obscura TaxID=109957 RepID=A0AAD5ST97_9FUNG|nr:hypothetical protein HK100_004091 [Physocladia obscura]